MVPIRWWKNTDFQVLAEAVGLVDVVFAVAVAFAVVVVWDVVVALAVDFVVTGVLDPDEIYDLTLDSKSFCGN